MAEFSCTHCGKKFRWSETLAGKRAKCPCGTTITCPIDPPADPEETYDIDESTLPPPRPPVAQPAEEATPTLSYRQPDLAKETSADPERLKNFVIPFWLLVVGLAIQVGAAIFDVSIGKFGGSTRPSFDAGVAMNAILLLFEGVVGGTSLMLIAVVIAARFRGIELGDFKTVLFKLAAITISSAAVFTAAGPVARVIPMGGLIAGIGSFIFTFAMLGVLFDLDEPDTWYIFCIMFVINVSIFVSLAWLHQ